MKHDWNYLTTITGSKPFLVTRVALKEKDISIEGEFELPLLGRLNAEDQLFVAAFIKTHGSIKQMEEIFGISYPTVKNRLNAIGDLFEPLDIKTRISTPSDTILDMLQKGEIDVREALARLGQQEE